MVQCFWITPTLRAKIGLRRYVSSSTGDRCPDTSTSYHQALVWIGEEPQAIVLDERGFLHFERVGGEVDLYDGDPRWPTACEGCGRAFTDDDEWQVFTQHIYRRDDTGDELTLRDAPPGAMWDAWWFGRKGPDGRSLIVRLPNGLDWHVDGRASNCDQQQDNEHYCWVRHGEPPLVTVDKSGLTCGAGAGSIGSGQGDRYYHGFLRNGALVTA